MNTMNTIELKDLSLEEVSISESIQIDGGYKQNEDGRGCTEVGMPYIKDGHIIK